MAAASPAPAPGPSTCQRLLDLCNSRGMVMLQVNGQRVYGPPKAWTGPPPPPGCEVFVGRLPRNVFEDELVPLFERAGPLYKMRLMMDFSGSNRGFGFVRFCDRESAHRAILVLHDYEIRPGRRIGVVWSMDNSRLYVGNLPENKTREDVTREMATLVSGVTRVFLYRSLFDPSKNRGYAFVEFEDHRTAAIARRTLIPSAPRLWGQNVRIDWAAPEPFVEDAVMQKVTNLYIRNLYESTTEADIRQAFESVSGPNSVMKVKKVKDFAFVHFFTREDAEKNLQYWNDRELNGSIIEVAWAKPASKLQHIYSGQRTPVSPSHRQRSSVGNIMEKGRPITGCRHQDCLNFSNQQPTTLGSLNSNVGISSGMFDDFRYTGAPHYIPFTIPDGLTVPLIPQTDLHSSMAPGPMLAPNPIQSMDFSMTYSAPGYVISGNPISSFEAPFYQ